jgi:ABC-type multidrug transport system fused ATPase/permease subunit
LIYAGIIVTIPKEARWMLRRIAPYWRIHLGSVLLVAAGAAMAVADPLIMRWIIDRVIPSKSMQLLAFASVIFLAAYSLRLAITGAGGLLSFKAMQRMMMGIRMELFQHIECQPAEYHEKTPVGDLVFRSVQDIFFIGEAGGEFIVSIAKTVTLLIFVFIALFALNARLACLVVPLLPLFLISRHRYQHFLRKWADTAQQRSGELSSFLHENYSAAVQIQLLRREAAQARKMFRAARLLVQASMSRRSSEFTLGILSMLILVVGAALVLGYGGYQVMSGKLTVGGLVAFYSCLMRLFDPLSSAISLNNQFQRMGASIRRILEIMETRPTITDAPHSITLPATTSGCLNFQNIQFSYGNRGVFDDLSLTVQPGETVALVGPTGCGKSTVAKLAVRLYDTIGGSVQIDHHDIRDIKLRSLRKIVSVVPQDPRLFSGTIYENILCGNILATRREVERAAGLAQLDDLLMRLPHGWNEQVGSRAGLISGGERQRIVWARTFLQDPRILIVDEGTSALDPATEKRVMQSLMEFARGRTVLIISHRLATVTWVDRMVVLQNGNIVEEGSHRELCCNGTVYLRLWQEMSREEHTLGHSHPLLVNASRI